jgi:aminopeptidase-like protein
LWVLNLSDGIHSLLDIAEISGIEFDIIMKGANALIHAGLLKKVE